ncbi:MAG: ATP-dependent DNA helicase RecG [Oscillospiraceae bacterium]|nr:ATP-dependent DNA helicase RecG [Oscillospiraceae bacterium]
MSSYDSLSPVSVLRGVGPKKVEAFEKLGVHTLGELVSLFPRRYEDRTHFTPILAAQPDQPVCIRAMVAQEPRLNRIRRGMEIIKLRAVDDTGAMDVSYFNQPYRKNSLHKGETYIFFGKVTVNGRFRQMTNPVTEQAARSGSPDSVTGRIMPVYPLAAGLTQRNVLDCMKTALDVCLPTLPDVLPDDVVQQYGLARAAFAYENIHLPADLGKLELARRRLIFEELFVLACAMRRIRADRGAQAGQRFARYDCEEFYRTLPFSPTNAQRRAVEAAVDDLCSGAAMNRLVQGDVGSGKTLVAAACIWYAHKNGCQSAFMAPTEILAEQHEATLKGFLEPLHICVARLTGSMTAKQKRGVYEALADGRIDVVVGTHALIQDAVQFQKLALVVTDEQHRFGVQQRAALGGKGEQVHTLVMSATPIPRTLALMIYGDLDVSVIDELPPGRHPIETYVVDERYRERLTAFIEKLISEGRQAFVVCPMVEESDELPEGIKSAEEHARTLQALLPNRHVACIHGRMKAKDKEAVMAAFVRGETDVLVATTVIEVGVDVPNAALMIVENAERFGLSQLHQLRGRIGRGRFQSYCILVSDSTTDEAKARLKVMKETSDGFKIAEADLKQRGPGDFFGSRQHGLPEMHIADLGADMTVLEDARDAAEALLKRDPTLSRPEHAALKAKCDRLFEVNAGRLN